jgi:hypothetical protein
MKMPGNIPGIIPFLKYQWLSARIPACRNIINRDIVLNTRIDSFLKKNRPVISVNRPVPVVARFKEGITGSFVAELHTKINIRTRFLFTNNIFELEFIIKFNKLIRKV